MNIIPYFLLDLNSSDIKCILFMIIVKHVSVNTLLYTVFDSIEHFYLLHNPPFKQNQDFDAHRYASRSLC